MDSVTNQIYLFFFEKYSLVDVIKIERNSFSWFTNEGGVEVVGRDVAYIASLPPYTNIPFLTIMANQIPDMGRG